MEKKARWHRTCQTALRPLGHLGRLLWEIAERFVGWLFADEIYPQLQNINFQDLPLRWFCKR